MPRGEAWALSAVGPLLPLAAVTARVGRRLEAASLARGSSARPVAVWWPYRLPTRVGGGDASWRRCKLGRRDGLLPTAGQQGSWRRWFSVSVAVVVQHRRQSGTTTMTVVGGVQNGSVPRVAQPRSGPDLGSTWPGCCARPEALPTGGQLRPWRCSAAARLVGPDLAQAGLIWA